MAKTVKLEISEDLYKMIKELANKDRKAKNPVDYISNLVMEKYKNS